MQEFFHALWAEGIGPILFIALLMGLCVIIRYVSLMAYRVAVGKQSVSLRAYLRWVCTENDDVIRF